MPVLVVKFEGSVVRNVPVNGGPITIGRAADNSIAIDNLSVSTLLRDGNLIDICDVQLRFVIHE
jgi:hypothetical protein